MKIAAIIAAGMLITSVGAGATEGNDGPAEDEIIQCRFERVTGSRTKAYRVCLTKAEWNRRAVAEREELVKYQNATTHYIGRAY